MPSTRSVFLVGLGLCTAGCSSTSSTCATAATAAEECPAEWAGVATAMNDFCAEQKPLFNAFRSTGPCRGRLHYTRHLFDGGPRYCLYDPVTLKLVGYAAFDPKALREEYTCRIPKEDFDDQDCPGVTCQLPDAGAAGD
jgi:hypothetical protein